MMRVYHLFGHIESEASTLYIRLVRVIGAAPLLEEMRQYLRRYTYAGIFQCKDELAFRMVERERDRDRA